MNIATKIKDGHGNLLFKMLIAKQESCEVTHENMWGNADHMSVTYDFEDKSLITFKVIDDNVTMQVQNERC